MADLLPFDDMLETASIPKRFEVKASLFDRESCKFTVINYRDQKTHELTVRVTRVSNRWPDEYGKKEFELEGKILEIDGRSWGPPANRFQARYIEDSPRASGFKVLMLGDPLPNL